MRVLVRAAHHGRKLWWRIHRPQTLGVKVIVRNPADQVLLVQPTYSSDWQIPGGGVKPFEHPKLAGIREVREETGIELAGKDLRLADVLMSTYEGKSDVIIIYTATCAEGVPQADGNEIAHAGFFAPDALPADIAPSVHRPLAGPSPDGMW